MIFKVMVIIVQFLKLIRACLALQSIYARKKNTKEKDILDLAYQYFCKNGFFIVSNGWNYATTAKENDGIDPYENSGTYLFGWWALLEDERITNTYSQMAELFPLDDNVIKTYVGPNTTRNHHEMVAQPNLYENGYSELICRLVSEIYEN